MGTDPVPPPAPADEGPGGNGVFGFSNAPNASGVFGANNNGGFGVAGESGSGVGVRGHSDTGVAIEAVSEHADAISASAVSRDQGRGNGIVARRMDISDASTDGIHGNGVFGFSNAPNASGVFGANNNGGFGVAGVSANGYAVKGIGRIAGRFEGDVEVTGDIKLTGTGGDCAEEFDIQSDTEPGTVMVINQSGNIEQSHQAYDKKVAGVVSGAGNYKPAIILNKKENTQSDNKRIPIALMGRVYCKVDACHSPIETGDLLTTSPTEGHAMKAEDPLKAFGAVIGKALKSLREGKGMIPVLVALQ